MSDSIPPLSFLTISNEEYDANDLLREWRWLVPESYTLHLISASGDLFLGAPDDAVYFLCLLEGTLTRISPDLASFQQRLNEEERQRQWFHADWVGIAYERGLIRQPGQCYGWRLAPSLGGSFEFANLHLFTLRVYESFMGQLHRQVQSHPPGYQITGFRIAP